MAEETLAQIDSQKTQSAEDSIADFLFGEQQEEEEYQPDPKPVVEGDEFDGEEVSEDEEEPEKAADDASEEAPQFVEVEFNGQLYEVPNELKDALLRQDDYTRKTQEVAEQRKSIEVINGELETAYQNFQFAESVRDDVMKAHQARAQADQYKQYLRDNVDNLSATEIEKLRIAIGDSESEAEEITAQLTQKQQEHQQAQEQSRQELLKKGTEILKSRIPNWGEESQKQLREYATAHGYSEQEIAHMIDPRHVEALWKASQYDALKAGATPAVKRVTEAPQIKPKARNPMPDDVKQKLNLRKKLKSGNLSAYDKANLIGDDIASRFFQR